MTSRRSRPRSGFSSREQSSTVCRNVCAVRPNPRGVARLQSRDGLFAVATDDGAAMAETFSSELQGESDVGKVNVGVLFKEASQIVRRRFERRTGLRGEQQQLERSRRAGRLARRGLFEDDVRVSAADAEGADARAPRGGAVFPLVEPRVDVEGAVVKINLRVG